jgi:hypothetical protein
MPVLLSDLDDALDGILDTSSGKIEWDANSLQLVITTIRDLIAARTIMLVDGVEELQNQADGSMVMVKDVGEFVHQSSGTPNYTTTFPALGGGIWKKQP